MLKSQNQTIYFADHHKVHKRNKMLLGIVRDLFSFDHQWQLIFLNKSLI